MSDINIDALLAQMRAMAATASGMTVRPEQAAQGTDFGAILKGAIDQVNQAQQNGAEMARAFEAGEAAGGDLVETMITLQSRRASPSRRWCRCATRWSRLIRTL
jgi:flagellar hook-basal body complex protein FliE